MIAQRQLRLIREGNAWPGPWEDIVKICADVGVVPYEDELHRARVRELNRDRNTEEPYQALNYQAMYADLWHAIAGEENFRLDSHAAQVAFAALIRKHHAKLVKELDPRAKLRKACQTWDGTEGAFRQILSGYFAMEPGSHVSQQQAAIAWGVPFTTIDRWMEGLTRPHPYLLEWGIVAWIEEQCSPMGVK